MNDLPEPQEHGLSFADKMKIRALASQLVATIQLSTNDPRLGFVALLNVLASLIARFPPNEVAGRIHTVQTMLPMYVETYRTKEKKV